jgi:hypothetical protein
MQPREQAVIDNIREILTQMDELRNSEAFVGVYFDRTAFENFYSELSAVEGMVIIDNTEYETEQN